MNLCKTLPKRNIDIYILIYCVMNIQIVGCFMNIINIDTWQFAFQEAEKKSITLINKICSKILNNISYCNKWNYFIPMKCINHFEFKITNFYSTAGKYLLKITIVCLIWFIFLNRKFSVLSASCMDVHVVARSIFLVVIFFFFKGGGEGGNQKS